MTNDPKQYNNLASDVRYVEVVKHYRMLMDAKIKAVLENDLGLSYSLKR